MRFDILGPLRVSAQNRDVPIRGELERCLLAVLLLHAGRTVPVDWLAAALWEGTTPRRPG